MYVCPAGREGEREGVFRRRESKVFLLTISSAMLKVWIRMIFRSLALALALALTLF
jgi:hypothetical protein